MYSIFLDDIRNPQDITWINLFTTDYVIVRNYSDFVNTVSRFGVPFFVTFDHDLSDFTSSDYEMTGYDCAKWLVEYCIDNRKSIPKFAVHSMNSVGAENIRKCLLNARRYCK